MAGHERGQRTDRIAAMRLAVVGSGVAGLACAHLLGPHHDVVLFEADRRLGGHANTVDVDDPAAGPLAVDTGFIVHNDRNYPHLQRLLADLGVSAIDSEMSFAVTDRATGFCYRATNLDTLLASRANALDPRLWRMLADIIRFQRAGRRFLASDPDPTVPLARFLADGRYSDAFVDLHLIPMGAAVWSADPATFDRFPAASLLHFLHNHGLLSIGDRPQWKTIVGGSRAYVEALARRFRGEIRLASPVTEVARPAEGANGVTIRSRTHPEPEPFDQVILATHSDQALDLLADPTPEEKELLGAVRYQPNQATLHTDTSLLPPRRKAWAAWNYDREAGHQRLAALTYDLTNLQRLPGARRYLVSLNSDHRIRPDTVLARFDYAHPVFDGPAVAAQPRIAAANGLRNTWFAGAWLGYGFHEDGM
ncbi:MAG: FAD-dependent oxidoreductase, partial [Acidimicrobiia bacterium]|nr:FAD-dependent oxidoreductase [Acidimicrobiia bacterium]